MKLENFDNFLLIVGNLGELKIYKTKYELAISRQDKAHTSHKHHKGELVEHLDFELLHDEEFIEAHKKISDLVTDKEGHFEGVFGGESGEAHNLELTIEYRILKLLANHINKTLQKEDFKKWIFAFPAEYNKTLFNMITQKKDKLYANIEENLVKDKPINIIKRAYELKR